jgi:citrate lyase beta subunit
VSVARQAGTVAERGQALEELIATLLPSVPGILPPIRNVTDFAGGGEIDVLFANKPNNRGLWFLPNAFLTECKNWQNPVGAQEIRVFTDRLRERACQAGILIAANGITGDAQDHTEAQRHISRALEQGFHILVVTLNELDDIRSSKQLVDLLQQKWVLLKSFLASI